jgi:hypothetical protein
MKKRRASTNRSASQKSPVEAPNSVFINCPFDKDYRPLFDAIVFAATCCGFLPRSALETGDVAELRIQRILKAMFSSDLSIHELSRCQGEGEHNLARFNMPLELGMAMARAFETTPTRPRKHDWLVLVPAGHVYQKVISDLAGYDPKDHDGSLQDVVRKVMSWLVTRQGAVSPFTPGEVLAKLPEFQDKVRTLRDEWGDDLPWAFLVSAAKEIAEQLL